MESAQTSTTLRTAPLNCHSVALTSALHEFRAGISEKDINECEAISSLSDLQHAISEIERDQASRSLIRNTAKIRPLLGALENYSKVIEVFVNAKPDLLAFIWGPIKLCLQIAANFTGAFDALLDTYQKLGDSIPIFSAIEETFASNHLVQSTLVDVYRDILVFHHRSLRFFRKKGWQIALKLTFHTFEELFGDIMKNLENSKQFLLRSADLAHFQESSRFFHETREARLKDSESFKKQQDADDREKQFSVLDWLQPTSQANWYNELQNQRVEFPGTTSWIFEHHIWKDWIGNIGEQEETFWLSGIPGAGKTCLFSSIIHDVERTRSGDSDFGLAFFYCKYNDPLRNTYEAIAKGLISQFLKNNKNCLDYLHDVALKSGERHANTKKLYSEILSNMILCYHEVFIGIDGLDECEPSERKQTLSFLRSILSQHDTDSRVKLLLSSCAEKDIERSIGPCKNLHLKPKNLSTAIECYVQMRLTTLNQTFKFSAGRVQEIIHKITSQSNGMFLLARLILDTLEDTGSREDVEEELENDTLPHGINQAYDRILNRLRTMRSSKNKQRATLVLEVLVSARRPLKLHEVQAILSVRLDDRSIDLENRRYVRHLKDLCGPIVEVSSDYTVDLVHSTAKRYLDENHSAFLDMASATGKLTEICVNYLSFDCFVTSLDEPEVARAARAGHYALQDYAICSWIPHILDLRKKTGNTDAVLERCFLVWKKNLGERYSTSPHEQRSTGQDPDTKKGWNVLETMQNWCCEYNPENLDHTPQILGTILKARSAIEAELETDPASTDTIFLREVYGQFCFKCPVFGCREYQQGFPTRHDRDLHSQKHIRKYKCPHEGCDFQTTGFSSQKTLDSHILYFHEARRLTYRFPILKSKSYLERLEGAIDQDDAGLVQSLCLKNTTDTNGLDLLERAVRKGSQESFKFLLEFAQFKSVPSEMQGEILLLAIQHKNCQMTLRLVEIMDASLLTTRSRFLIASMAVSGNNANLLRLAIALNSKDIDSLSTRMWSIALAEAVDLGFHDIVSLLLDNRASLGIDLLELEIQALKLAKSGNKAAVRELLGLAPFFEEISGRAWSEKLEAASTQGLDAIVEYMMIRSDGEVNAKGKTFGNSLQKAALAGKMDKLKELIDRGADIHSSESKYGTALAAAVRGGHTSMVQWLLSQGASIVTEDQSSLVLAATMGDLVMVRFLLQAGAEPSERADFIDNEHFRQGLKGRGTSLHAAAKKGFEEIAVLLLDSGADVHVQTTDKTPKSRAFPRGSGETALHFSVELESQRNYSRNKKRIRKRRDAYLEKERRRLNLVKALLDRGAEINARDLDGMTPFHRLLSTDLVAGGFDTYQPSVSEFELIASIAKLLLDRGADVNARDVKGNTPFHQFFSSLSKRERYSHLTPLEPECLPIIPKILIDQGADVNTRDLKGNTPLHSFFLMDSFGSMKYSRLRPSQLESVGNIVKLLIELGADLGATNMLGQVPKDTFPFKDFLDPSIIELLDPGSNNKADSLLGEASHRPSSPNYDLYARQVPSIYL